mgnify:CR=1 FL=1
MQIIECPRDAMQGIHEFIDTPTKTAYINKLLQVGFHSIDFGSFVSPKAIPQMRDTVKVLNGLDLSETTSKLLAIVGNLRGAERAASFDEITYLGFPFSISDTFQQRNINSTIEDSFKRADQIRNLAEQKGKEMVMYISMAFGNPYGDPWNKDIVIEWSHKLHEELDVKIISLSDTIGVATPDSISYLFSALIPALPQVLFGAHLHTTPDTWEEKVEAAYKNGCERFDGAIRGLGGCPMAKDDLTGNMPTENLIHYFNKNEVELGLNQDAFFEAVQHSQGVFPV